MIGPLTYALVLIVHPDPQARVYATFSTAEACRTERAAVVQDLQGSRITAACVPQNQLTINDVSVQMKEFMRGMQDMQRDIERQGVNR